MKPAFMFVVLCTACTITVGLRWTFDIPIFRFIQPILASLVPISAWYCFSKAHQFDKFSMMHYSGPLVITSASLLYPVLPLPIDLILVTIYVFYGSLLIKSSLNMAENVHLENIEQVARAERIAGIMLLFLAFIDAAIGLDFWLSQGRYIPDILSVSYVVLIPAITAMVIIVNINTSQVKTEIIGETEENKHDKQIRKNVVSSPQLSVQEAKNIVNKIDALMREHQLFLDLDLTLTRLSKKMLIPSRQISMAVNQVHGKNISKVINEYRILHAQKLLIDSEESITQILLNSGFQTKSNFNREFVRITGKTPSEYRSEATNSG